MPSAVVDRSDLGLGRSDFRPLVVVDRGDLGLGRSDFRPFALQPLWEGVTSGRGDLCPSNAVGMNDFRQPAAVKGATSAEQDVVDGRYGFRSMHRVISVLDLLQEE